MDDKFFLAIVDKFNSSEITELDFNDGNIHLVLRKGNASQHTTAGVAPVHAAAQTVSAEQAAVHLGISATAQATKEGEKIVSPIVATFYSSPSPDSPAFVKPGTKVKAGQTLCILEAMKMMNHLEAEFDCEITEVLASNGDLVEYGQNLFIVKRN
ncbi:MAG: acetyl-CoA carboxylase biotin carboxyl carrier protein [Treponema sp.]|nr:acetyl-CoA carboxylase biotin carboxyl carrier protein [Treponema sp.]MCL2251673.1 acetyl-CoA carboxylase biotin carboxyl carrier protein [Treponema sp.]